MHRRTFLCGLTLGTLSAPLAAEPEQPGRLVKVGILLGSRPLSEMTAPDPGPAHFKAFLVQLRNLGYVEGQNLVLERRSAEGKYERLPEIVAELVRLRMDVIVVGSTPAAHAAKQATSTIPIVFAAVSDPVGTGLVASLARPGGNVTGVSDLGSELIGKRLDLLKELVPRLSRVAVLGNPSNPLWPVAWKATQTTALAVGMRSQPLEASTPDELVDAFKAIHRAVDALIVVPDAMFVKERVRIVELAAKHRLPASYELREFVQVGGLMSYSASWTAQYQLAASYVDKILKGARPADLPVEQPTKFDLAINLRTAKALGLTIPPSVLLRADQVIE